MKDKEVLHTSVYIGMNPDGPRIHELLKHLSNDEENLPIKKAYDTALNSVFTLILTLVFGWILLGIIDFFWRRYHKWNDNRVINKMNTLEQNKVFDQIIDDRGRCSSQVSVERKSSYLRKSRTRASMHLTNEQLLE